LTITAVYETKLFSLKVKHFSFILVQYVDISVLCVCFLFFVFNYVVFFSEWWLFVDWTISR